MEEDQGPNRGCNTKGGGKVKLSLYLTEYYAMKMHGGVDVYIHVFLSSTLVGGEWSHTQWTGGWVSP
jgi:hypothetical protein